MQKITMFLLAGAAAISAVPAAAQEEERRWDGIYVGGSVGIPVQDNDGRETVLFDTDRNGGFGDTVRTALGADAFSPGFCGGPANGNNAAASCRNDSDNEEYFVRLGADRQVGNLVVGVVLEGGRSNARDSVTAFSSTPASYTFTREMDWSVGARGRLGYTPTNSGFLMYVTGGVTYGQFDNSFQTSNTANSFTLTGEDDRQWGAAVGGGAEVMLTRNLTLGLEYLYTRYNEDDFRVAVGPGTAPPTNPFLLVSGGTDMRRSDPRFDTHAIRATAAIRF